MKKRTLIPAACALLIAAPAVAQQGQQGDQQQRRSNIERSGAEITGETRDDTRGSAAETSDRSRDGRDRPQDRMDRQARMEDRQADRMERNRQEQDQQRTAQRDSKRMEYRQVRGTVQDVRRVNLRGQDVQTYLVLLETDRGNRYAVDVGEGVRGLSVQQGQEFSARGREVQVAPGRTVLMASNIFTDDRLYDVNRPAYRRAASR